MRRARDELESRRAELEAELGEPITLDALTGDYVMFQRRRGHRHSTDDLLTAWYAIEHATRADTICDLGTGIGSVGLAVAWHFSTATLTAIEVQDGSFRLFTENLWANDAAPRVRAVHGDLREATPDGPFDLVTGSPPYFDVSAGIVSSDPQRAGARFELRGNVTDYCKTARRIVAPGGRFVFCFPTAQRDRAERAIASASLRAVAHTDVVPRATLAPLFTLFACARDDDRDAPARAAPKVLTVRDERGEHTADMLRARQRLGHGSG